MGEREQGNKLKYRALNILIYSYIQKRFYHEIGLLSVVLIQEILCSVFSILS